MSELRRLLPRQFADWSAKYAFADGPDDSLHDCKVIDISSAGAGLELSEADLEGVVGRQILLVVHLRGQLRNARPGKELDVRAGVQFLGLTRAEHEYLTSLAVLQTKW
jgi:hypothetical protein